MALFENEIATAQEQPSFDESIALNPYLAEPSLGLKLVSSLLERNTQSTDNSFDVVLQQSIFPVIAKSSLRSEFEVYRELTKISSRIKERQKIKLLSGKSVIGVGGKFSSGKSKFINSITKTQLPIGQRPTTSIATYIVHSESKRNSAITCNDLMVNLDDDAVEALTHRFFDEYGIGFSRIIKNLVLYTSEFPYENIVILDTPGYSKADTDIDNDISDKNLAYEQLKAVDYLIWLIDASQAISASDVEFIKKLELTTDVFFVFTKADTRTIDDLSSLIRNAEEILDNSGIGVAGIIAYNSYDGVTVIGENTLTEYLEHINNSGIDKDDVNIQINDINKTINNEINENIGNCIIKSANISRIISEPDSPGNVEALMIEWSKCNSLSASYGQDAKALEKFFSEIRDAAILESR